MNSPSHKLDPVAARLLAEAADSGRPNAHLLPIAQARAAITSFYTGVSRPPIERVEDVQLSGRDGPISGRLYQSVAGGPLIVFFHGGGWLLGSVDDYDPVARRLALATGATVVSVDYRRGPEHRFPAAVDDAYDATCWAGANAESLGADPARLIVMGDSAGGNLAAVTAIRCRDESGPPLSGQILIYPVTTCDLADGFTAEFEGLMLFRDEMQWHQDNYLRTPDESLLPWVAPLGANLRDLPATAILLAECDPIAVQGARYAAELATAGVEVTLLEYPGMIHGFFGLTETFAQASIAFSDIRRTLQEWARPTSANPRAGRPNGQPRN